MSRVRLVPLREETGAAMNFGVFAVRCRGCETAFLFFTRKDVTITLCPVCTKLQAEIDKARATECEE